MSKTIGVAEVKRRGEDERRLCEFFAAGELFPFGEREGGGREAGLGLRAPRQRISEGASATTPARRVRGSKVGLSGKRASVPCEI